MENLNPSSATDATNEPDVQHISGNSEPEAEATQAAPLDGNGVPMVLRVHSHPVGWKPGDPFEAIRWVSANASAADERQAEADELEARRVAFRAAFDALPDDLSGVNLAPIYELVSIATERNELRNLERLWKPNAKNVQSYQYPGPISEDGKPLRWNLRTWKLGKQAAIEDGKEAVERDLAIVGNGGLIKGIAKAMSHLSRQAFAVEGDDGPSSNNPFDEMRADSDDVAATLAAIRICRVALDELERMGHSFVCRNADYLRDELRAFENLRGELAT